MLLALSEIRHRLRLWVSVILVQVVTGLLLALSFGLTISGASDGNLLAREQYSGIGGVQIGFVSMAGIVCIAIITRVVVRMTRVAIAQWQLAGVSPSRAARTVFLMTLCASLLGSTIGVAVGYLLWAPFGDFVAGSELPFIGAFSRPLGVAAMISAWGCGIVSSAVAGLFNLRSVSKVEAVEAVRQHPMGGGSFSWSRSTTAFVLIAGLVLAHWGISLVEPTSDMDELSGVFAGYWGTALLVIVIVVVGGGPLVQLLIRGWTALVPARWAVSWFLARSGSVRRGEYSSAIVIPLFVAGGTMGSIYGMARQVLDAADVLGGGSVSISPPRQMVLVFGGPIAVALATTIGAVVATSQQTMQDLGLLAVVGVGRFTLLRSVALEYVTYCATALLLCYGALTLNGYLAAQAISRGPIPGAHFVGVGWSPLAIIAGGFGVALLIAVLPLVGRRLNSPVNASRGNRR